MNKKYILATAAALILALSACGKKAEAPIPQPAPAPTVAPAPTQPPVMAGVAVGTISLGNAIDSSKNVTQASDSFGKKDTIYVSVNTLSLIHISEPTRPY